LGLRKSFAEIPRSACPLAAGLVDRGFRDCRVDDLSTDQLATFLSIHVLLPTRFKPSKRKEQKAPADNSTGAFDFYLRIVALQRPNPH
jgi:hypothetical protein